MTEFASAIWRYRNFIFASIRGELKGRFAHSSFGAAWFILNPLAQAAIFALVLSEVMAARLGASTDKASYPIYLMAGMAAWGLFSEIVNRCLNVFIEFAPMLKKIAFPRICLPIIIGGSAILTHVLLLLAMMIVFSFFGHFPGANWLAVPLGMLLIALLAFGIGILLGIFNVFLRDIGQMAGVVLQIWFWLTPVVYPIEVVPKSLHWLLALNPMAPMVRLYQDALLYNRFPHPNDLLVPLIVGAAFVAAGLFVFRRASPELVDVL